MELTRLHEIRMAEKDSVVAYPSKIQILVYGVQASSQSSSELHETIKDQRICNGVSITAEVTRPIGLGYSSAVLNLIILGSSMNNLITYQALSVKSKQRKKSNKHRCEKCYPCKWKGQIDANCFSNPKNMNSKGGRHYFPDGPKTNSFTE